MNSSRAGTPSPPPTSSPVTLAVACEAGLEQLEAVLRGPGMPRGLHAVTRAGDELRLEIDAAVTSPLLVQAIVAIEARRFGAARIRAQGSLEPAAAARVLGAAIGEPALDERRIIENHLAELEERQ